MYATMKAIRNVPFREDYWSIRQIDLLDILEKLKDVVIWGRG